MINTHRIALLTGVALPVLLASPEIGSAGPASLATPIVVAQADGAAAAQAEVAAAEAALQDAQASGGDVAAARARLDAALDALAAAQAATGRQPEPQPEPTAPPQPPREAEPQPQQPEAASPASEPQSQEAPPVPEPPPLEAPPQPQARPAERPAAGSAPVPEAPPESPAAEQAPPQLQPSEPASSLPPATRESKNPAPQAGEAPPALEEPPPQPPAAEAPPVPPAAGEAPVPGLPAPQQPQFPPSSGEAPTPPQLQAPTQAQPQAPVAEPPAKAETQPPIEAPPEESAVESQLEAQGDQEAVENVRSLSRKLREEFARGEPEGDGDDTRRDDVRENSRRGDDNGGRDDRRGDDRDRGDGDRRHRDRPSDEGDIILDFGLGIVVELGNQLVIRRDSASESERFLDRARDVDVEHFRGGYTRTVVTRRDGTRIYTVRNRYGDIITRTRVLPNGRQIVLIDNSDFYRDGRRPRYGFYDRDLPPLRIDIPRDQYVVETSRYGRDDIRAALMAPPVEAVEHPYSLEEIRTSQRLRDKLRRVDLNTITFDFGSAAISPSQFEALAGVGSAIEDILARSPNEVFLLEGYTDAVGSPTPNLILSDQRAEAIAVALSSNFAIPPENLITQGYGEQYLKVPTEEAERENRRVTVRRITPLVAQSSAQ